MFILLFSIILSVRFSTEIYEFATYSCNDYTIILNKCNRKRRNK